MRARVLIALFVCGVAAACGESTAPEPAPRVFVLDHVDDRALPVLESSYAGDSTFVVWAVLTLEANGRALKVVEHRFVHQSDPPVETTTTGRAAYLIAHDSIAVGFFGTCRGACVPNEVGGYTASALTLTLDILPRTAPVYHYHRADNAPD
ncbi:MAG TPA: hypothetical protein VF041_06040 [Gemmatimonadaceae bacterium]